mmetsp:Transcript_17090/g.26816  ORF Transcript_17090/g.26816 Transcript_17090/m.26816 type:complete len:310 (+) Transcript_17090:391-1320(+)
MMLFRLLAHRIFSSGGHLPPSVLIIHQIPLLQNLETSLLQRRETVMRGRNVRQPISLLDLLLDRYVLRIIGIVLVRQTPLVTSEDGARLQHAADFRIATDTVGSVARGLDRVGGIEARRLEGLLHEVSLYGPAAHVRQSVTLGIPKVGIGLTELVAPVHLVLVQRESRDIYPGELANVAHGPADAASDVQNLDARHGGRAPLPGLVALRVISVHPSPHGVADLPQRGGKSEFAREVELVPPRGLIEGLVRMAIGEVEGGAPAPFVEEGGEVVVGVDQVGVVGVAFFDRGFVGVEAFVLAHGGFDIGRRG